MERKNTMALQQNEKKKDEQIALLKEEIKQMINVK